MNAHTPGPWHRNIKPATRYPVIFAGRNTHVCQVDTRVPEEQAEANCNLIAAAPELLALLQAWTAGCGDEHFSTKDECRELIQRSGEVIAKALGK